MEMEGKRPMTLSLCVFVFNSALKHRHLKNANSGINATSLFSILKNAERFAPGAFVNALNKEKSNTSVITIFKINVHESHDQWKSIFQQRVELSCPPSDEFFQAVQKT